MRCSRAGLRTAAAVIVQTLASEAHLRQLTTPALESRFFCLAHPRCPHDVAFGGPLWVIVGLILQALSEDPS